MTTERRFKLLGLILVVVLQGALCWTVYQRHKMLKQLLQHREQPHDPSVAPEKELLSPIVVGGPHPYVKGWYVKTHSHPFRCKDDPYACASCPVGPADRVIKIAEKDEHYDVPIAINAFFSCGDINMLVPEKGYGDSDEFFCEREPQDGFIEMGGHRINCAGAPQGQKVELGTLNPGESKSVTIPIPVQP